MPAAHGKQLKKLLNRIVATTPSFTTELSVLQRIVIVFEVEVIGAGILLPEHLDPATSTTSRKSQQASVSNDKNVRVIVDPRGAVTVRVVSVKLEYCAVLGLV